MCLVFPEIVLASAREGEATGNPSSSFFGPILFLGNIQKKETNKTLRKNFMNGMNQ